MTNSLERLAPTHATSSHRLSEIWIMTSFSEPGFESQADKVYLY